jgi:DNA-binding response OmpR family regulator
LLAPDVVQPQLGRPPPHLGRLQPNQRTDTVLTPKLHLPYRELQARRASGAARRFLSVGHPPVQKHYVGTAAAEISERIVAVGITIPVIFLTVLSDYEEAALEGGAVDFIDKARRLPILLKRLELIAEGGRSATEPEPSHDLVHGKDFIAGNGSEGYRANVRTFIKRIRKKFRDVDPGFDHIENYASFGYRWIAGN